VSDDSGNSLDMTPGHSHLSETNLIQALRDFDIANARVIDLTGRLANAQVELLSLRSQLDAERAHAADLRVQVASMASRDRRRTSGGRSSADEPNSARNDGV
jgi:hypothetical protein